MPANLHFLSYWDVLNAGRRTRLLTGGHRLPDDLPGHAQEFETSLALAAFPENVRQDMWADQEDPKPALSNASTGQALWDRIIPRVADYLNDMIARAQEPDSASSVKNRVSCFSRRRQRRLAMSR